MKILNLTQGTPEWKEERRKWATASDMASILGIKGAFSTRKRLLKEKLSGIDKPLSEYEERIFARGHQVEAELRKKAEIELGMEFQPVTLLCEEYGILASIDAINFEHGVIVETKNSRAASKIIPAQNFQVWEPYRVQVLTQMFVAQMGVGFVYLRDDVLEEDYLVPVNRDDVMVERIKKEARAFVDELRKSQESAQNTLTTVSTICKVEEGVGNVQNV